jgi:LCP family protein required for cell wall assembly
MSERNFGGSEPHKHFHNTDGEDTIVFPASHDTPQSRPQYQQQYSAPQQGYANPQQQYSAPQQGYANPQQQYSAPQQGYTNPQQQYSAPQQGYANPQQQYSAPQQGYANPQQQYSAPQQGYATPQQGYANPQYNYYNNPIQYAGGPPPKPRKSKKKSAPVRTEAPAPAKPPKPPKQKKKRRRKTLIGKIITRILLSLLSVFLILFGIYSCTSISIIRKMNYVKTGERIRTSGALSEKYVRSVLVIGTDGRTADEHGLSDSMILISLNRKTDKIYMTSFMRDCYVDIPGYGNAKLNAAYSYGGPELLMDTIEQNFRVKIDDYISINFNTFATIIDAAGGLDIQVSDAEAEAINTILISEVNELMGDDREADLLQSGGKLHLNGKQALSYSRIRSVGNNDFERTNRQRKIITALIKKARKSGLGFVKKVSKNALPSVTTNMTTGRLYLLSLRLPFLLKYDTTQLQIPAEGTYTGQDIYSDDGTSYQSVLTVDFDANHDIIKDTVFAKK